jgi:hypothetical protein
VPVFTLISLILLAGWLSAPAYGQSAVLAEPREQIRPQTSAQDTPLRLHELLQAPEWLLLHGSQRTRYEGLQNQFRPLLGKSDQALALRTLLTIGFEWDRLSIVAEVQDSRAYLTDADSGISTIVVNALEPLQAYVNLQLPDALAPGAALDLRAGLQTMELGGRRLIARNRFRNTIQNYAGSTADWRARSGISLFTFAVLPVRVEPGNAARADLVDNRILLDRAGFDLAFWGAFINWPLQRDWQLETYFFGLNEDASGSSISRNRQLYTPGLRLVRAARPGRWDADLESVLQFGSRRSLTSPTAGDSTVRAHFLHASVGYTLATRWSPRISAELDYASGDDPATPDRFERFDSLFGPRRAEFGPTDIYGLLGRANIISAGARLGLQPTARLDTYLSWRANWLANSADFFASTGLRDPSGAAGRFAGHQLEVRSHFWLMPDSLRWELGGAVFRQGPFMRNAPGSTGNGNPVFFYTGLEFFF